MQNLHSKAEVARPEEVACPAKAMTEAIVNTFAPSKPASLLQAAKHHRSEAVEAGKATLVVSHIC